MTAGTSYTNLAAVRDYLGFQGTQGTATDGILQDCIDDATRAIEDYTRRVFLGTVGTAFYSRYYQHQVVNQALYLDQDLHTLTAVTNGDGQTIPVGSCWTEPRNAGPPYRILRLKSSYVWVWNTDSDLQVVGTWGYGTAVPGDIRRAAVQLSAYYYRLKDTGVGDVSGFQEGGEVIYPKGIPDTVKILLAPYRSRSGGKI